MKALQFGAGNIGRGLIGKLLSAQTDLELIFADVQQPLLDQLNQQGGYAVHTVGLHPQKEWISGIKALHSESQATTQTVATADLITTAVGPAVLPAIAPLIARGLIQRATDHPNTILNIIACENSLQASTLLKQLVLKELPDPLHAWVEQNVGFVDAVVDQIIPPAAISEADLSVSVEPFSEWIINSLQIKGALPEIAGVERSDQLMAFVERKLFTLNTGHAITAYLGALAGETTIRQAILNPEIAKTVQGAMQESGAVLIKRYGFDPQQHAVYINKIIERFKNPWLDDVITRVARQPLRKLEPHDRLIKPLLGAAAYGLPYHNLIQGIAAALHYCHEDDPQAVALQSQIESQGVAATLSADSGLDSEPQLVAEIVRVYAEQSIKKGG